MSGETQVVLCGNLTDAPELRFTPAGAAVASFTIASTPRVFDRQSGEYRDGEALFMRCSLWKQAGEHASECLVRGQRVIAVGRLKQRSFEVEGQKRTVVEMDVEEIGPSLKFGTATFSKASRGTSSDFGSSGTASNDPWAASPDTDQAPF